MIANIFTQIEQMEISDKLYGNIKVSTLVKELLNTAVLQRLNFVHQSGAVFLVNPAASHKRLAHSIGVMHLVQLLGGSELEQIAGLLHDISHTAFSHVGDYVMEDTTESYHERIFEETLTRSDIPQILRKYGYTIQDLFNGQFDILEQPLPYLCADRIDYTLRDALQYGFIKRQEAMRFVKHLAVAENNKIVVTNNEQALWINNLSKQVNEEIYNYPLYVYANQQVANIIKKYLSDGYLVQRDLHQNDTFLLNKIRSSYGGLEAIKAIKMLSGYKSFLKQPEAFKIKKRYIDAFLVK
ncbi:HD domain-containing protein [Olivibacter sp. CPCC 100613]|uniref:HD domain-containing protein n=1 Tax=Olivibacter sp. CPCC 100613 TaxID=3079931 RepID=UPI002FF52F77